MWAKFDETSYPIVNITLTGVPENDEDFNNFLTKWDSYNTQSKGQQYIFIIETKDVGFVNPKYAFRMSNFIKELKTRTQFLKASIIKCNSIYTSMLLRLIFWLQKPVADVYIVSNDEMVFIKRLTDVLQIGVSVNLYNEYTTIVHA